MPFGSGVPLFTHCCDPLAQLVTPVRQASGFPSQASPAVQALQTPPLHTWFTPQLVPFEIGVSVSTQVSLPVVQDVVPWTHEFGFVEQEVPAVQALHVPPLHTWFVPQLVPFVFATAVSRQVCAPVEQSLTPSTHGFGFVEQAAPAVQALQAPAPLHTASVPQLVPGALGAAVSTHAWVPVAQLVTPSTQTFGLPEQASPAVQALHAPPLHTWFTPQVVPFGIGVAVSTQVSLPVAHDVVPCTQAFGFVPQATPAVQVLQHRPLQTWFAPQLVPFGIGVLVSRQSSTPVLHEVMPATHAFGFVEQATFAVHATQMPLLHT